MAAYLLRPSHQAEPQEGWLMRSYVRALQWCLRRRGITAVGALLFFVGSIALAGWLPTGFVPASDRGQTQINLELPPGSTLPETLAMAEQARAVAARIPHVKSVFSSVGGGSSGDAFSAGAAAEPLRAALTLLLTPLAQRNLSLQSIEAQLRDGLSELPGARFQVGPPDNGTMMQIVLRGEDPQRWRWRPATRSGNCAHLRASAP